MANLEFKMKKKQIRKIIPNFIYPKYSNKQQVKNRLNQLNKYGTPAPGT